ncbi:NAD(P)-dependent oxidoreductase [Undibacterium terreum]|uniref:Dehydrogenase n=1 Tax=Undibacterium terreum TaxID=1224302 RepID=A0A916XLI2_9BURK|nr:NAD(P)-dependent oxidoreductase [Undibacterium terreum]GGC80222.1 dehydrogenase [Undibacterium terreum]
MNMDTSKRIAFLGTGLMGKPMAKRLLEAGHRVIVWNRTASKAEELLALGAQMAVSPAQAVRYEDKPVDFIITMLEAGHIVEQVMLAALPAIGATSIFIDMSSTKQSEAVAFHSLLAQKGIAFVDAPVSGGVLGAEAGSLAIMVGAHAAVYAKVEEILKVFGRPTRVGEPGSGQLAKLCNQLIVGGTLSIIAEALLLAQAGGADPVAVRAALRGGFAESRILEVHGQRMLDRNFMPGGQVKSQAKDMENVLIAAQEAKLALPVAELVTQAYRSLLQTVPNADQSAALLGLEQLNPGLRLGTAADKLPG